MIPRGPYFENAHEIPEHMVAKCGVCDAMVTLVVIVGRSFEPWEQPTVAVFPCGHTSHDIRSDGDGYLYVVVDASRWVDDELQRILG